MEPETQFLETAFEAASVELGVKPADHAAIKSFLAPLRNKNEVTHQHYLHSLRVGLVGVKIAQFVHMKGRPIFFAGMLHDIGKVLVPLETLGRTEGWSEKDQQVISRHVMDGYRMLNGRFGFTAAVMVWHHRFQDNGYPKVLPAPAYGYSERTKLLIVEYGRLLALSDVYDALHRRNDKFKEGGGLSGAQVKEKMLLFNPDRVELIEALYGANIFSTDRPH